MTEIKGCWFRKKKTQKAAAIAAIQRASQRCHRCHLAQYFPGCFANTWDKQTRGLYFRAADLGLSNSKRNQSFELEWLSQEKKYQFPVLTSHPTVASSWEGEVMHKRENLKNHQNYQCLSVTSFCNQYRYSRHFSFFNCSPYKFLWETGIAMLNQTTQDPTLSVSVLLTGLCTACW